MRRRILKKLKRSVSFFNTSLPSRYVCGRSSHRLHPRIEPLEPRLPLSGVSVNVLDPAVEPGQEVGVEWTIDKTFLDTSGNGELETAEIENSHVVIDALGGIKNQVEFSPSLTDNAYIDSDGNLTGIASLQVPVVVAPSSVYQVFMTVENSSGSLADARSAQDLAIIADSDGVFARTMLVNPVSPTDTVIEVASLYGFPVDEPFEVFIGNGADAERVRVIDGFGTATWIVERAVNGIPASGTYEAGTEIARSAVEAYESSQAKSPMPKGTANKIAEADIEKYVETINGSSIIDLKVREWLVAEAVKVEQRAADAVAGGLQSLPTELPNILSDVFDGRVQLHHWDPNLPTVVLVHGVFTWQNRAHERGELFQEAVKKDGSYMANVVSYAWGFAGPAFGFYRSVDGWIDYSADTTPGRAPAPSNALRGAIELNKLLRFFDTTYEVAGITPNINVIAHSQGTIVTAAALSLDATKLEPSDETPYYEIDINQVLFIGANLHQGASDAGNQNGQELLNVRATMQTEPNSLDAITNLCSKHDNVVLWGSGLDGAGNSGFSPKEVSGFLYNYDANPLDDGVDDEDLADTKIVHSDIFGDDGWWDWLERFQRADNFLIEGITSGRGFPTVADENLRNGGQVQSPRYDASRLVAQANADIPPGVPGNFSGYFTSPLPPSLSGVALTYEVAKAGKQIDETVPQGDYFIAEAVGASDPDGFIFRADFFRDLNLNGLPDGDPEYLGTDFHASNGWKRAIYTTEWAFGDYDVLCRVVDNGGNESIIHVATVQIVDPGAPPAVLPASLASGVDADFGIVPHRNGDISYALEVGTYPLAPGHIDYWAIAPEQTRGYSFTVTGMDTVIGLYDTTTGNLDDFAEGTALSAVLTATLTGGRTYYLGIVAQNGAVSDYELAVTGPNQDITSAISVPSPQYRGTAAGTIDNEYEGVYYSVVVPAGASQLTVTLDPSAAMDGFVRVEDSLYETRRTNFLAGAGKDDVIVDLEVTPGETLYITVSSINGTGSFDLTADFDPDDSGLPAQVTPIPALQPVLPLPDGNLLVEGLSISVAQEFDYYLLPVRQNDGGEFTIETFGDTDTQIGVYRRLSDTLATLVVEDDDSGAGKNGRVTYDLTGGDDYVIVVRAEDATTGDYDLSIQGQEAFISEVLISGLALTRSTNYASIANNNRYVFYEVTAPEGVTTLTVQSENSVTSTTLDTSLRLTDSSGAVLGFANDEGPGVGEELLAVPVTPGETYTVTIYGEDFTTGSARGHFDFDPDVTVGSGVEFPINSAIPGRQFRADVAQNASGLAVVVWANTFEERIDAQRFGADGLPVGSEFQISSATTSSNNPKVGMASNGDFVVLWDSTARVFNANGTPATGEFDVGFTHTYYHDLAVEPSGRFFALGGDSDQVLGRLFSAAGTALTAPLVLDDTADEANARAVDVDGLGNFIVTWTSISDDNSTVEVYALRLDNDGNVLPSGRNFYVDGQISGRRFADANGNLVQDPGEAGIAGVTVLLDANGNGTQDGGEATQITAADGSYTFTGVAEGIYHVVQIAGTASGPGTISDNFNRSDSTDMGSDWTEDLGDCRVEGNATRTAASTNSRMVFEGFESSAQTVEFDIHYDASAGNRVVNGAVYLAYADADHHLRIRLQDNGSDGQFERIYFDAGGGVNKNWPRMSGGPVFVDVTPFQDAHIFASYDPITCVVTLGIDRGFDGTYETTLYRGGVLPDGLGTKVGLGGYNNVMIDNFEINPGGVSIPSSSVVPTEAFRVAPGQGLNQWVPAVGGHPDGTFAIAYESQDPSSGDRDIYVQRFAADASISGPLVLAHNDTTGDQTDPAIAVVDQGKFLVAWTSPGASRREIFAQQFGVDGTRVGPSFMLSQAESYNQGYAALASDGGEKLFAAWESDGQDTSQEGIFGVTFTLDEILEPELTILDSVGGSQDRFITFGIVEPPGVFSHSFTVRNDDNAPLTVTNVGLYGVDAALFQISDTSDFVLAPDETRVLSVDFLGTDQDEYYAAVRFKHDDDRDSLSKDYDEPHSWINLLAVVPDTTGPTVTHVLVKSETWSSDFLDYLDNNGYGLPAIAPQLGYSIPAATQLDMLPWIDIDTVSIVFDEYANVVEGDLALWGVTVEDYITDAGYGIDDFTAPTLTTFVATWTLNNPFDADKVLIDLDGDSGGVSDAAGNLLDGEWVNGSDTFPSGNASAGGDFQFQLNIVPGDVGSGDNATTFTDFMDIYNFLGSGYSIYYDIDTNAFHSFTDCMAMYPFSGRFLPVGDPSPPPPEVIFSGDEVIAMPDSGKATDGAWKVLGTAGDDAFEFTAGNSPAVVLNGQSQEVPAGVTEIIFDGAGGNDTAHLYDSPGDDLFVTTPNYGTLSGDGFSLKAVNFHTVNAYATAGGYDVARMYDSAGDDVFDAAPTKATLYRSGGGDEYFNTAHDFEEVHGFSTAGGQDVAMLYDSPGDDTYRADANGSVLSGDGFELREKYFETVHVQTDAGGNDTAYLVDAVLESSTGDLGAPGIDFGKVAWLYDFEQLFRREDNSDEQSVEESVDEILRASWR